MKMKTIISCLSFFCFFIVSIVIYGDTNTSGAIDAKDNSNVDNVNFTDFKKSIIVKREQPIFTIILRSNPTTGFSWTLKEYNSSLIKPISRSFTASKKPIVGAGGYETWIFAVKSAGFVVPQTTDITLVYARPWDFNDAQETNFKVVTSP